MTSIQSRLIVKGCPPQCIDEALAMIESNIMYYARQNDLPIHFNDVKELILHELQALMLPSVERKINDLNLVIHNSIEYVADYFKARV